VDVNPLREVWGHVVYTVADYLWMISDGERVGSYAAALRALVHPGDRVLEVGAGFGFFSILAVRAGAAHADAVETNPVVHLGPKVAAANGCADRITFHAQDATRLTLDPPADVLLADIRGPLPFSGRSLEVLIDARRRLLRPGGVVIAARDDVFVAPVRTPAVFRREVKAAHQREGVRMDPVERVVYDTPMRCVVEPGDLLAPGSAWTTLDYGTIQRTDHCGSAEWIFDSPATVEGLALWFETYLGAGISFSTAPGSGLTAYRQTFLPFRRATPLAAGDALRVRLDVRLVVDDYLWEWRVAVRPRGAADSHEVLAQNSLAELIIDPAALPPTSPDTIPALGGRGRALRLLLDSITEGTTVAGLGARLRAAEPDLFENDSSAVRFVAQWLSRLHELERGAL
jgi:protein arginine N-methyltransferase 1